MKGYNPAPEKRSENSIITPGPPPKKRWAAHDECDPLKDIYRGLKIIHGEGWMPDMTDEQKAAYVFAQAVAAQIRLEGMKAQNILCIQMGQPPLYGEEEFNDLVKEFTIGHNDILSLFHS